MSPWISYRVSLHLKGLTSYGWLWIDILNLAISFPKSCLQFFPKHVFKLHGMPNSIIFYRDKSFTSKFWDELFLQLGVRLAFSTSYHPQANNQFEVVNKTIENYLCCFIGDRPKDWVIWLPLAEWWYNASNKASTLLIPFDILYGYPHPSLVSYCPGILRLKLWIPPCEPVSRSPLCWTKTCKRTSRKPEEIRWLEEKWENFWGGGVGVCQIKTL